MYIRSVAEMGSRARVDDLGQVVVEGLEDARIVVAAAAESSYWKGLATGVATSAAATCFTVSKNPLLSPGSKVVIP